MKNLQGKLMKYMQSMDEAYEKYAKSKGMTYLSFAVLEDIYEIGDTCTQKQICKDTHYPKQTVNLTVKTFLEDGLIKLKEIPTDRRNKYIVLTEKGRKRCKDIIAPLWEMEENAITSMGNEKSEELIRLLELHSKLYCAGINEIV